MANVLRGKYTLFRAHFQSTRGRGSWDPNGGPQSTELQAFLGFPRGSQVLFLTAAPPAPLPSEHSVEYTKVTFPVKQNLRSPRRNFRSALPSFDLKDHSPTLFLDEFFCQSKSARHIQSIEGRKAGTE